MTKRKAEKIKRAMEADMGGKPDFYSPEHRARHERWDARFRFFLWVALVVLVTVYAV